MQQSSSAATNDGHRTHEAHAKKEGSGIKESSFWISQIFMILATVLGVYLAAQEGLNQAIIFDDLTSRQNNYYLRNSLASELQSNLIQARDYAEFVKSPPSRSAIKMFPLKLDLFVWESMRYSPSALETPSQFILEIQRYYREIEDIRGKIESSAYAPHYGAEEMKKRTERMEKEVLPKLLANIDTLRRYLKEHNVPVD
ncbi:hypothetical protein O5O45_14200 [Hahella aquimaris]|uniref:hypothetical protein n=1 Tax=Hahella sp. HNIBRBA332 TaxID=3015983 RepID=UPI00273B0BDA|nr:hypothetical protein [Hahella sp. HNIBRBA332]WLQ17068.1 hypothetical protein O5O45_14200 [Hahella sp. HNIBRBA332]